MNRKWKISLYLAAIFVAGVVTGMFISYQLVRHMMPTQERMVGHWCGELQSKLNLTPEQMQKIRPIVNDAVTDFRNDLSREMLLSLANCNARVVLELTPEQKAKFEQIQKEQEEFIRMKIGGETSSPPKKP
jgi:Spy/CpxP family protein refolding chaperone